MGLLEEQSAPLTLAISSSLGTYSYQNAVGESEAWTSGTKVRLELTCLAPML